MSHSETERMQAKVQMFLLEKRTNELPPEWKTPEFLDSFIKKFLGQKIKLKESQKEPFYSSFYNKMKTFKDLHPSDKNTESFKRYLTNEMNALLGRSSKNRDEFDIDLEMDDYEDTKKDEIKSKKSEIKKPEVQKSSTSTKKVEETKISDKKKEKEAESHTKKSEDTKPSNSSEKKTNTLFDSWKIPKLSKKQDEEKKCENDTKGTIDTKSDISAEKKSQQVEKQADDAKNSTKEFSKPAKISETRRLSQRRSTLEVSPTKNTEKMKRKSDDISNETPKSEFVEPVERVKATAKRRSSINVDSIALSNPLEAIKKIQQRRPSLMIALETVPSTSTAPVESVVKPKIVEKPVTSSILKPIEEINRRQVTIEPPVEEEAVPEDEPRMETPVKAKKGKKKHKPGPKSRTRTNSTTSSNNDVDFSSPPVQANVDKSQQSCDISKLLDEKSPKDLSLKISGTQSQLCNNYMELNEQLNILTLSKGVEQEKTLIDLLTLKELLYWPGVGIKVELKGFTIQRHIVGNIRQEAVKQNCTNNLWNHNQPNDQSIYRHYASKADKSLASLQENVDISLDYIRTIIEIMLVKCLPLCGKKLQKTFETIFDAILIDLDHKDFKRFFQNTPYSYFLNKYKYFRIFEHDVELSSDAVLLVEREFFNPEVVFSVPKCDFQELKPSNYTEYIEYFKSICVSKNEEDVADFQISLNNGFSLYCVECGVQFKSANKIREMSEHLKSYRSKKLNCVKCEFSADMREIIKGEWVHECLVP
ncbi:titin-like [Culicoides brevitarsis]|uniref:titin-like n=1 Tax=Culicoides brevitarsis TaxID=469753 RepID=UPI00307B208F